MFNLRILLPAIVVLAFVAVIALVASSLGGSGSDAPEPAPEPTQVQAASGPAEQALGRWVETTLGKPYLEDCSKATAERDSGKICSVYRGERGNLRAFVLGGTFSEGTQWAFVEQRGEQWNVVHTPPITRDTAGLPGIPWPLTTGVDVVVVGGDCLNVRIEPAIKPGNAVDCIRDGTRIRLAAGPVTGDSIQWWQVQGRTGWVAGDYLRYPDALQ